MREYRKVSKGVIFAIVIAVIVIGVSLISLLTKNKLIQHPKRQIRLHLHQSKQQRKKRRKK